MTMNIYITKDNEKYLREMKNESNLTMSGLINDLLFHAREVRGSVAKAPTQKEFEDKLSIDAKKINIIKTKDDALRAIHHVDKRAKFTGYIPPGKKRSDYS